MLAVLGLVEIGAPFGGAAVHDGWDMTLSGPERNVALLGWIHCLLWAGWQAFRPPRGDARWSG